MKHFITMMFALLFSVILSAKPIDEKITIQTVQVEAPCRIITYQSDIDTTMVNIRNNVYDLIYEIKDDVLYIKPTRRLEDFEYCGENPPIVQIALTTEPKFKVSNSFTITERKTSNKKIDKSNDVAQID